MRLWRADDLERVGKVADAGIPADWPELSDEYKRAVILAL
jgi:hypothetical protein